jgi:hypothetical protein
VLSFDYLRQERIQRFLNDGRKTGRPKSIIVDGCILIYDLLVIGFASRTQSSIEATRKRYGKLRPLAKEALADPTYSTLKELILALAAVRNKAAHEPMSDDDVEKSFVEVWQVIPGDAEWPKELPLRSAYCRATFSLVAFELGRWQVGLPPSGQLSGNPPVDWTRLA